MTEKNRQILDLVEQGKTLNEISDEVKLSTKQIHNRISNLKMHGYNFERKFYYDGNIVYKLQKQISLEPKESTPIITYKNQDHFRAVVISDLHLGNIQDNVEALHKLYDFCIVNNINIILNCGDFIDGTFGGLKKSYDIDEQVKYALKNHPYDKSILNFICLGNHDESSKTDFGLDFGDLIVNKRPDLIPVGYGKGIINVKNDQIVLEHPLHTEEINQIATRKLTFRGHTHEARIACQNMIYVPSLSNIKFDVNRIPTSAFLIDITLRNGYFSKGIFNQLFVDNKVWILNEFVLNLTHAKTSEYDNTIKYEEEMKISAEPADTKVKTIGSQIEKFNKRYGRIK